MMVHNSERNWLIPPPLPPMQIGDRCFRFEQPALMGVINLSADSWFKPSVCLSTAAALQRGRQLLCEGADFIDVGAESSLLDAARVSPQQQIEKLVPVVSALSKLGALVSVESYYPQVLEAAAKHGVALFNLSGTREQEAIFKIAAYFNITVIHCYVQGETARDNDVFMPAEDNTHSLVQFFSERIKQARAMGVKNHVIDAGLGFSYHWDSAEARLAHQVQGLLNSHALAVLGCPILNILPHAWDIFTSARNQAAAGCFAALSMLGGTHIVRSQQLDIVRDVRQTLSLTQKELHKPICQ